MEHEFSLVNYKKAVADLDNDTGLYKDLLECWFSEIQFDKALLERFIQKDDLSGAAAYVHRIKGAAGSLGAQKLFDGAQKLESILRGKTQGDLAENINALTSLYEKTNKEFMIIRKHL